MQSAKIVQPTLATRPFRTAAGRLSLENSIQIPEQNALNLPPDPHFDQFFQWVDGSKLKKHQCLQGSGRVDGAWTIHASHPTIRFAGSATACHQNLSRFMQFYAGSFTLHPDRGPASPRSFQSQSEEYSLLHRSTHFYSLLPATDRGQLAPVQPRSATSASAVPR
jgi:hypothetical protein